MKVDKTKWNIFPIKDISIILNGYAFKSEKYCSDGIRIIRITNVQDGFIEDNDPKFYSYSTEKELQRFMLHEGDILISLTGNVGRVGILNDSFLPAALNQRVGCIRPTKKACVKFLYYQLRKESFKEDCIRSAKGVAQLNMSTEWLKEYKLFVPSLSEQQSIATELDSIQTMIDGYKAQLADFDALAQSIFLDIFGDVAINNKSWDIIPMGQLGDFKNGLNYNKGEKGKTLKIIGVGDFQNLKAITLFDNIPSIEVESISQEYLLQNEDIVFVRSNGNKNLVGRCLEVYPNKEDVTFSGFCIRFRKSTDIVNKYLVALLTDTGFKKTHILKSNGIGIQNINQKLLGNLPIPVPPIDLQKCFAMQIKTIERQKEFIHQQLADAEQLMAERMQYYFS